MNTVSVLRGKAISQYGSLSGLAEALGWSYSKLYRILHGRQEIVCGDVVKLSTTLHLSDSEVLDLFIFPVRSENETS